MPGWVAISINFLSHSQEASAPSDFAIKSGQVRDGPVAYLNVNLRAEDWGAEEQRLSHAIRQYVHDRDGI